MCLKGRLDSGCIDGDICGISEEVCSSTPKVSGTGHPHNS